MLRASTKSTRDEEKTATEQYRRGFGSRRQHSRTKRRLFPIDRSQLLLEPAQVPALVRTGVQQPELLGTESHAAVEDEPVADEHLIRPGDRLSAAAPSPL